MHPGSVFVRFDPVLSGTRLDEAVWDNGKGPFWDINESHRIGFDQHYRSQFYAIPNGTLPAVAQSAAFLVDSRIVMPFGRIFTGVFEDTLRRSWSTHSSCFVDQCSPPETKDTGPVARLAVKIEAFVVWEAPLNHLNLYARGVAASLGPDGGVVREARFENSVLEQKLGSIFSTHASMIRNMNEVANDFAGDLVADILQHAIDDPEAPGPQQP